jgi:hypothetical protein
MAVLVGSCAMRRPLIIASHIFKVDITEHNSAQFFSLIHRNGETETEPPIIVESGVDEDGVVTLRPNRFRPEAGIRNRLRNRLHEVLEDENDSTDNDSTRTRYASCVTLQIG